MKFTVAALLIAGSNALMIEGDDWKSTGLPYDFDEPTRDKAKANAVAKTHAFNGATKAHNEAAAAQAAANAAEAATAAADAAAGKAKADAAAAFAGTSYKAHPDFEKAEAANAAAVKAKEASLDAHLKAFDDKVAKDAADAHLAANDARVAWEKDQLERGQNQDRLKHVNENTSAKTSEILGKHDERERANGRLLKALASF